MKLKKLPWYFLIFLLTLGASLTLGFLSFGGVFVAFPIIGVAVVGLILSVAYEAEIYFQNITGSLKKLLKFNYFEQLITNEILQQKLVQATQQPSCPQFFIDYEKQLHLANNSHDRLQTKKLKAMEEWFSLQLFSENRDRTNPDSQYQADVIEWISNDLKDEHLQQRSKRQWMFRGAGVFSLLSGIFMGLGTTYLVMESLAVFNIAFVTLSIPGAVVPMFTLIFLASVAYGLLTYHAITDMINNETLKNWFMSLRENFRQGLSLRNVLLALLSLALVTLAISLTLCTAGTWWTIAKEAQPFFSFMAGKAKEAIFIIMGCINPVFMFISSFIFNIENIKQTYDILEDATHLQEEESWSDKISKYWQQKNEIQAKIYKRREGKENAFQLNNIFLWLLDYTLFPLRFLLFMGHIVSIGATADRMPGLPPEVSGLLGVFSEGFEDAHYFLGDHHKHLENPNTQDLLNERFGAEASHNHDTDIPTRLLKLAFSPLYFMAIIWDWSFSKLNSDSNKLKSLSFAEAFCKHTGWKKTDFVTRSLKIALSPLYLLTTVWDWSLDAKNRSFSQIFLDHLDWGSHDKKQAHDHHHHHHHDHKVLDAQELEHPSTEFELTHLIFKLEKHRNVHFVDANDDVFAQQKQIKIKTLIMDLKNLDNQDQSWRQNAQKLLKDAKDNKIFDKQRNSFFTPEKTKSIELLESLKKQIAPPAA